MRVDLCGRYIGVPQHCLHRPRVSAALQQMDGIIQVTIVNVIGCAQGGGVRGGHVPKYPLSFPSERQQKYPLKIFVCTSINVSAFDFFSFALLLTEASVLLVSLIL